MKPTHLGKLFNLHIDLHPLTWPATLFLWFGLIAAFHYGLALPLPEALLLALAATLLHWISLLFHHLGHIIAARLTGYPISGLIIGTFGLLARDLYPTGEPELAPGIHIRRALGGPLASALLSLFFFLLLPLWPGNWHWLGLVILLENLFVFTLQVFIPLSFNDGGTLLKYLRR